MVWRGVSALRCDGREFPVEITADTAADGSHAVVVLRDRTESSRLEADLSHSERRFRVAAQSCVDIIWEVDIPTDRQEYFGDIDALLGYEPGGFPRTMSHWLEAVHPDDLPLLVAWNESVKTGKPYDIEFRVLGADGDYRWFRSRATAERDASGAIVKWWGTTSDVHDYHVLDERAQTFAQERQEVLESIGDSVFTLDSEMRFTYVNSNAEILLQHTAPELLGESLWDLFPEVRGTEV